VGSRHPKTAAEISNSIFKPRITRITHGFSGWAGLTICNYLNPTLFTPEESEKASPGRGSTAIPALGKRISRGLALPVPGVFDHL
jgi:hypothetical protein